MEPHRAGAGGTPPPQAWTLTTTLQATRAASAYQHQQHHQYAAGGAAGGMAGSNAGSLMVDALLLLWQDYGAPLSWILLQLACLIALFFILRHLYARATGRY